MSHHEACRFAPGSRYGQSVRTEVARTRLARVLGSVGAAAAFSARRTAQPADLCIDIEGAGSLDYPVRATQARQLRAVARPARYGRGEETLVDSRVRDTWEIPRRRVRIDRRRFSKTLTPMLDTLGADLGITVGSHLTADLHSVLLYEPGQFFLPHQDSEKSDDMIGTLVVTLPSASKGGELLIEHGGRSKTYRPSDKLLTFVAFYSDCRHEVCPLTSGHRIVITYNLRMTGAGATVAAGADPAVSAAVARTLTEHFERQNRLVYLLDHEYTERGLKWSLLKGVDAARVAVLRDAAQSIDCDLLLAPTEIHETWDCIPAYPSRRRSWYCDEPDDPEDFELGDLLDGSVVLSGAVGPAAVAEDELCATTPTDQLAPYDAQCEGYMGNYGNTMDRWYRRAAVVVWPRRLDFAVRAEGSPVWAMKELAHRLKDGTARDTAAVLEPFWHRDVRMAQAGPDRPDLASVLELARGLGEPRLATMLLSPFRMEELAASHAPVVAAATEQYGIAWLHALVQRWDADRTWRDVERRPAWVAGLADICAASGDSGVARALLTPSWTWLDAEIRKAGMLAGPSRRERELQRLHAPTAALLQSAVLAAAPEIIDAATDLLTSDDRLVNAAVAVLRRVVEFGHPLDPYAVLADHLIERLDARLDVPVRDPDDWSIDVGGGCRRSECEALGEFLADPGRLTFEWKLAEQGRSHIEQEIAVRELPVRHETRKLGRPYTLVLTKTPEVFEREARAREWDEIDLSWLRGRMATE